MRVAFEDAVFTKRPNIADAVLNRHMVRESVSDRLLTGATDEANEIFRLQPLVQLIDDPRVHVFPVNALWVPFDVEKTLCMIAVVEDLSLIFFGDTRHEFVDTSFVFL